MPHDKAPTESQAVLLARIDERTGKLDADVEEIKSTLQRDYVTAAEFEPVKRLAYGIVGVMLTSLMLAILALILESK